MNNQISGLGEDLYPSPIVRGLARYGVRLVIGSLIFFPLLISLHEVELRFALTKAARRWVDGASDAFAGFVMIIGVNRVLRAVRRRSSSWLWADERFRPQ